MSKGWPMYRRIISWGARSLARPLTSASDPMTGFFAITKEEVRASTGHHSSHWGSHVKRQLLLSAPINTSGFKIALELLLKSPSRSIAEVPYSFGLRKIGSSKLGARVMLKYVGQLLQLYAWSWGAFFHLLVAVGAAVAVVIGQRVWTEWRIRMHGSGELLPGGLSGRKPARAGLFPSSKSRGLPLESKRLV